MTFQQGVLPSIGFGTQIWGIPPQIEHSLRSTFARLVAGSGKGKSHGKAILLAGDPLFALATAPLQTFLDLLWAARASDSRSVIGCCPHDQAVALSFNTE